MSKKSEPMSLVYAKVITEKSPRELLASALVEANRKINEPGGLEKLTKLVDFIVADLNAGRLCFTTEDISDKKPEPETKRMYNGYAVDELTDDITDAQIGYLAGLTTKLKLDRYNLPLHISPCKNYKELTEGEAIVVIDTLKNMTEGL